MEAEAFGKGMAILAATFTKEPSPELMEAYHAVLAPQLDDEQWHAAVRTALEKCEFFPPPAVLLRFGRPVVNREAEAVTKYGDIVSEYASGRAVSQRWVSEHLGPAAADAFMAAGGSAAFAWCELRDEPFRRKAFVSGYCTAVDADPRRALPAPPERPPLLEATERVLPLRRAPVAAGEDRLATLRLQAQRLVAETLEEPHDGTPAAGTRRADLENAVRKLKERP